VFVTNESASTKSSLVSMKTFNRTDHKTSWNKATFQKIKGREMKVLFKTDHQLHSMYAQY